MAVLLLLVLSACGTSPQTSTLTVNVAGDGAGTVTSVPVGINVTSGGAPGTLAVPNGTSVTLTAAAAVGSAFDGWTGACTGTDPCVVVVDANKTVTATFVDATDSLVVTTDGTGAGNVTSAPAGIDLAAGNSNATFTTGTEVTLTATPATGSAFVAWDGACAGQGATCTFTFSEGSQITATFVDATDSLVVTTDGTGAGNVTSAPAGIDLAAGNSNATLTTGTEVTLTATPATGSAFVAWDGACAGQGATCTFTFSEGTQITATFNLVITNFSLTVGTDGGVGGGNVTSAPAGIDVEAGDTTATFASGTDVTLTATVAAGWSFAGWTGAACAGQGQNCTFTISEDTQVTATFTPPLSLTVGVVRGGTADGAVSSDPAGIDTAAGDLTGGFAANSFVRLTAVATDGAFSGWVGGGCDGVRVLVCDVTMIAAQQVTATFNEPQLQVVSVAAGGDDAVEFLGDSLAGQGSDPVRWLEGWIWRDRANLHLGYAPYHNLTEAAFRFANIAVPAGAIVTNATLQVTSAGQEDAANPATGALSLMIDGELSPNPGGFVTTPVTSTTFAITTRPRTAESVTWDITDAWATNSAQQAPNAAAIVQEIVDQAGWSSGNALILFLKGGSLADQAYRRIRTHESATPAAFPSLTVEYVVMPPLP